MDEQETACICQQKSNGVSASASYPTLTERGDPVKLFQEHGYFVIRGLLSAEEVQSIKSEISDVVSKWYSNWIKTGVEGKDWEEVANRKPAWKEGRWEPSSEEDVELGFRRLYRLTLESEFFDRLSKHDKVLPIVNKLIGHDVKLLQSMALLKPPGSGQKKWHQDNGYFRLTPTKVMGIWMALDLANCANGCMHILPQPHSEGGKFYRHEAGVDSHIEYSMVDTPNPDDVVPVILKPGDAMMFHGHLAHYTPPNVSDMRRRSIQFHYASSECQLIKCPRQTEATNPDHGVYFDCDPECQEQKYYFYKKGESLICGHDYGEGYI